MLAHQGLKTDYPSGKDPPVEERLQRTSWLATAKETEGEGGRSTDYMQRGKARGGSGGNQGREVGRVEPSDRKGTLEQAPEALEGQDQGEEARTRRGPRTHGERRPREATIATTYREDSAQREDPVTKELKFDRVTKEVKKSKHQAESQGGQETETEKDASKNRNRDGD